MIHGTTGQSVRAISQRAKLLAGDEWQMSAREVLTYVKANPFRAFRIRMNSGRTFDVRHPEMIRVGRDVFILFTSVGDSPDVFDHWETASLLLVEAISHLDAQVA